LIGEFADSAGKKGGELSASRSVGRIMCLFNATIGLVASVAMLLVPVALILHENVELSPGEKASPAIASAASLNKGGTVAESRRGGSTTATQ
jgi:hypothetical protein